jgi:hypothetical protein
MKTVSTKRSRVTRDDPRLGSLQYGRAYTLAIEALHTMCCESGSMRERLQKVDPEFFALRPDDLPETEGVRASFVEFHELATRLEPRWPGDGVVAATLNQSHHTKLARMAQLVWDIHRDFSHYMQDDAQSLTQAEQER